MPTHHDRPASPAGRPPAALLLPVLVWLNRRDLASRFPAWRPVPRSHAASDDDETAADEEPR